MIFRQQEKISLTYDKYLTILIIKEGQFIKIIEII